MGRTKKKGKQGDECDDDRPLDDRKPIGAVTRRPTLAERLSGLADDAKSYPDMSANASWAEELIGRAVTAGMSLTGEES